MNFADITCDTTEATLYIYGYIWSDSAEIVANRLESLPETVSTIRVRINSGGGSVFAGIAIYNLLSQDRRQIITHIDGAAASIASVIACAGEITAIAENAMYMVHNPHMCTCGEAAQLQKDSEFLQQIEEQIAGIYVAKTGKTLAEIKELMSAETWMKAQDAVDAGFADEITKPKLKKKEQQADNADWHNAYALYNYEPAACACQKIQEVPAMDKTQDQTQQTQQQLLNELARRDAQITELEERLAAQTREIESVKEALARREVEAEVDSLIAEGKLLPAQREQAITLLMSDQAESARAVFNANRNMAPNQSPIANKSTDELVAYYMQKWGMDEEMASDAATRHKNMS
ncbi:MAG: head maturation protease, ClpP-related [Caldilinea sp.]